MLDRSDVWRIGPTGGTPEQLTFHNSRVTFPTLLDNRTLLYLATDEEGFGPVDLRDRRRPSRPPPHLHRRRTVQVVGGQFGWSTARRDRFTLDGPPVARADCRPRDGGSRCHSSLAADDKWSARRGLGAGYTVYRAPKAGTDGLWKLADGGATELWNGRDGRAVAGAGHRSRWSVSRSSCRDGNGSCT